MSVEAKQAKQVVIDEIKEKFENAQSVVVVDYLGLSVAEADALRKQLREEGVDYTVYKNTLIKRAIDGTEYAALAEGDTFKGSTALAFSGEDVTAGARVLSKAIKELKKMAFKGGVVEGQVYDKEQIEEFANIPGRETLIARFMGSIQSPLTKLALTLKAIAEAMPAEAAAAAEKPAEEAPAAEAAEEAPAAEAAEEAPAAETAEEAPAAEAAEEAPAAEEAAEEAEAPAEA
jgi:large subunit ribosomal protein L10